MQQNVVVLGGSELKACAQVVGLEKRIILQDFIPTCAVCEQLQNVFNPKPVTANARPAAALIWLHCDA